MRGIGMPLALLVALTVSGCVFVDWRFDPDVVLEKDAGSLVGLPKIEVQKKVGKATYDYSLNGSAYLIYVIRSDLWGGMVLYPGFPLPVGEIEKDRVAWCYRLDFGDDDKLKEIKREGGSTSGYFDCKYAVWDDLDAISRQMNRNPRRHELGAFYPSDPLPDRPLGRTWLHISLTHINSDGEKISKDHLGEADPGGYVTVPTGRYVVEFFGCGGQHREFIIEIMAGHVYARRSDMQIWRNEVELWIDDVTTGRLLTQKFVYDRSCERWR